MLNKLSTLTANLKGNVFLKNTITLFSGTLIAQIIPLLLSPVITRIYSPSSFGSLTLFISMSTVIASVSAAKYEMTIVLPSKRAEAKLLSWISVLLLTLTTIVTTIAIIIFYAPLSIQLEEGIYFLPASIALLGLINILTYWHGRHKHYLLLSKSKVSQSVSLGTAQIAFNYIPKIFNGLIVAQVLGQLLFILVASNRFFSTLWRCRNLLNWKAITKLLKKYKGFFIFYSPSALLDNASMQAPVFILSSFFSITSAGIFGLTYRIVNIPLSLISAAIGQVYYQKIAELKNEGSHLKPYVIATAKKLFLLSVPPTLILLILGEYIFSIIFGDEWAASGYYAQILAIPFAVRFIASPLSSVLVVNDKLRILSIWQTAYFISTVTVLYIGSTQDLTTFIYLYGLNEVVLYLFYIFLIIKFSKK